MGKHTPGPWRAVIRANQAGPQTLRVSTDNAEGYFWQIDKRTLTAQNVADARLIAQAPRMLALIEVLAHGGIINTHADGNHTPAGKTFGQGVIDEALAIIEQVEGKQ